MHWRSWSWLLAFSWCQACAPTPATLEAPTSNSDATVADRPPEPSPPAAPHFVERIAHARGELVYGNGSPAHDVPVAIDDGCETLAGFTDARGRYAFDQLALPAHLRSLDGFSLSNGDSNDPGMLVPTSHGATVEMEPITLERKAAVYLTHLQRTSAATRFMQGFDLWGPGFDGPSWLGSATPEQVILARKLGFVAVVLFGDRNDFAIESEASPSAEAFAETLRRRVIDSRAALRLAELGQSRKPLSRVHTDAACVARASVNLPRPSSKSRQAP